jgi:hypothetical protein
MCITAGASSLVSAGAGAFLFFDRTRHLAGMRTTNHHSTSEQRSIKLRSRNQLRICWLQCLIDLVRRDRLATLNPVYEILQLRLPVHVAHQ